MDGGAGNDEIQENISKASGKGIMRMLSCCAGSLDGGTNKI
jgi:hypothetical protein